MCNSIFLGKKTLSKAKEGEEFEVTVKGVYTIDEDGDRKLDIMEVDGDEVADPMSTESECGAEHEDLMNQDGEDALRIFLIKSKKA